MSPGRLLFQRSAPKTNRSTPISLTTISPEFLTATPDPQVGTGHRGRLKTRDRQVPGATRSLRLAVLRGMAAVGTEHRPRPNELLSGTLQIRTGSRPGPSECLKGRNSLLS